MSRGQMHAMKAESEPTQDYMGAAKNRLQEFDVHVAEVEEKLNQIFDFAEANGDPDQKEKIGDIRNTLLGNLASTRTALASELVDGLVQETNQTIVDIGKEFIHYEAD